MDDELAKNLVAIWQSELTAMAADRELHESWVAMIQLWARIATTAAALLPHDPAPGGSFSTQPARAAPADAASEPGLDEVSVLNRRVAELERRLAELLEQRDTSGHPTDSKII